MTEQDDVQRKSRKDLLWVLLILPFGVLCMFMTGQAAIRLAPEWVLNAEMRSLLDPDAEFAARGNPFSIPPLNPNILTLPAWGDLFLTPNVTIPTRVISTPTPVPPARTPRPPVRFTPIDDPDPTATAGGPIIRPTPGGPLEADLTIEKSDNSLTYTPGTPITYTILVTNAGPHTALRFNVVDRVPAVIRVLSVNCTPANLCGTNNSNGNNISFAVTNLPFVTGGNQITITVSGQVASGATGDLSNTAEIFIPTGSRFKDPNLKNNTATDTDQQRSVYDLAITKSDGVNTFEANVPLNYTIVVTNSGPSDALGIRIRDNIPSQIASWTWSCRAVVNAGGCNGVSNSTSNFIDKVNIRLGGRIEYAVTAIPALLPQNPVNLTNRVRILLPGGPNFIDPDLSNNSASDTNRPYVDLQVTKDDGSVTYTPGSTLTYTVTVTNVSSFNLTGVRVTDNLSPMFSTWTWSCAASPGASCLAGSTDTNINDTAVILPPSGVVTYTIDATVRNNAAGTLVNTATVDPPAGLVDAVPGDNTATDSNTSAGASEPNIGPPNGGYPPWTDGGPPIILVFGPPIVADGDVGTPDFVYYEYEDPTPPAGFVALDWVQLEISTDGASWITVFNWGDGVPDTNSNADYSSCPAEEDNCRIPFGNLYNQTGITIDVDPLVRPGRYSWIRITAPASPGGDAPEVDAIQPYYP